MTITQTVDIPASHRLTIDVPREIPAGPVILTFTPSANQMIDDKEPEMDETEYLMRSPANREHLEKSIKEVKEGKFVTFETMKQLKECVKKHGTERGAVLLQEARERGAKLAASGAFDKCNVVTLE